MFKKTSITIDTVNGPKVLEGYKVKAVGGVEIFLHASYVGWLARFMDGRRITPHGSETRLRAHLKANFVLAGSKEVN